MAKLIKANALDCAILCIDTWYFGYDHYLGAPEKINMHFGRCRFVLSIHGNVIHERCQDVIVPFAMDSINGAQSASSGWVLVPNSFIWMQP